MAEQANARQNAYQGSQLYKIRHSSAHIMAQAVREIFPDALIAIGPPIEDGFYYDFGLSRPLTEADLLDIEERMKRIIKKDVKFVRREVSADEARQIFHDQKYKLELIDGLQKGDLDENGEKIGEAPVLTTYQQDTFVDLCRGPHVESSREIDPNAIKVQSIAGAYWRGDARREQLQRIYATAFESKADLDSYLKQQEEAKLRDHRKVGIELGLFAFSDLVGKGLPLWKPKGAMLRDTLERFLREKQIAAGYQPVVTPHIGKIALYETSGHYPYYADSQYSPIEVDDEKFMLKPMNCPHHIEVFRSDKHSYRDLPIRYAEFGTVYRYEKAGQLSGLTRVRGFTQDDAHIFVTPEQLEDEFIKVIELVQMIFTTMDFPDYRARIGTRDPNSDKFTGDAEKWDAATQAIINAADRVGMNYFMGEGEAAFYGPKLDFIVKDVIGRDWQLGTIQVDYVLPERFSLEYVGEDNSMHRPIMIHRAPFGSMERFIGILIEHFGGAFPPWLAPVQVGLVPVADRHIEYLNTVKLQLASFGIRAEVDASPSRMNAKIRDMQAQKIPWMLIAGDRDVAGEQVSVRLRSGEDLGAMAVTDFIGKAVANINAKSLQLM